MWVRFPQAAQAGWVAMAWCSRPKSEILRQNGYDTSWYGMDHNVPKCEASPAGPFHNWPNGPVKGFHYFYGFVGNDTSQRQPYNLYRNTTAIEPYLGNPGWNLITAMADEAIGRIKMLTSPTGRS
jgi:arylsulfatase A-like enzyme